MTSFDDLFAAAAFPVHAENFGESIIYRPRGGAPRCIRAIVDRHPPAPLGDAEGQHTRRLLVEAQNCPIHGVASGRLDRGNDQVDVAPIKGGAVETMTIVELLSDKNGMTKFEVR